MWNGDGLTTAVNSWSQFCEAICVHILPAGITCKVLWYIGASGFPICCIWSAKCRFDACFTILITWMLLGVTYPLLPAAEDIMELGKLFQMPIQWTMNMW